MTRKIKRHKDQMLITCKVCKARKVCKKTYLEDYLKYKNTHRRIETPGNRRSPEKTQQRTEDAGLTTNHQNPIYPSPGQLPGSVHRIPTSTIHQSSATNHQDISGKPPAAKALHKSDYYDTPPCIRGRLGELSGYATARGDTSGGHQLSNNCLLYTSPSPRDKRQSRMPSSA